MNERFEPNKRPWALASGGEEGLGIRVIDANGQTVAYFLDWRTAELVVEDSKIGGPKSDLVAQANALELECDSLHGKLEAAEQRVLELEAQVSQFREKVQSLNDELLAILD